MNYAEQSVLVVDDDEKTRKIIIKLLAALGFLKISEASDGLEAFDLLNTDNFDLILSDWDMPTMNGLELLKRIRADEKLQTKPFIMITEDTSKDSLITAAREKVSQYISKPFTAQSLQKKIDGLMKRSHPSY